MYDDEAEIDHTKLKYVLYARKSTDDPQRQLRSIPDQIDECNTFARNLGIKIVDTITEEKSAKKPGKRPEFDRMLIGLRTGAYDGILAWNPDRLARNMKEGGEIIDMVDEEIIKDLKFVTHHFTRDANGKMLLGMAFVLSKQYSDKLSQDVSRGSRKGLEKGRTMGTPKHGYIRDEDGIYRPDGNNFTLICKGWEMRKSGKSLEAIAKYMTEHGYARTYKDKAEKAGQKVLMTDKILSDRVFNDPFYYGVLIQTGKHVDLRVIPGYDFQPATDEETYNYVQSLTGRRTTHEHKRAVFKPLIGMVFCAYCNKKMYPQTPLSGRKNEKVRILSYRCDTAYCPRKNKELKLTQSVRANVIFTFMYEMLEHFTVTQEDYDQLHQRLVKANATQRQEAAIKLHSKQGALKNLDRDIKDRSLKILSVNPTSAIYKSNEQHINELSTQRDSLVDEITKLEAQRTDPEQDVLSFEEFLNVANKASLHLKAADIAAKDRIARLIYLNVVVDSEKVVDYQIREPFATYFKMHNISNGRGERT
jgi:DNA invertase Pin-like site-specific DNA recombinase